MSLNTLKKTKYVAMKLNASQKDIYVTNNIEYYLLGKIFPDQRKNFTKFSQSFEEKENIYSSESFSYLLPAFAQDIFKKKYLGKILDNKMIEKKQENISIYSDIFDALKFRAKEKIFWLEKEEIKSSYLSISNNIRVAKNAYSDIHYIAVYAGTLLVRGILPIFSIFTRVPTINFSGFLAFSGVAIIPIISLKMLIDLVKGYKNFRKNKETEYRENLVYERFLFEDFEDKKDHQLEISIRDLVDFVTSNKQIYCNPWEYFGVVGADLDFIKKGILDDKNISLISKASIENFTDITWRTKRVERCLVKQKDQKLVDHTKNEEKLDKKLKENLIEKIKNIKKIVEEGRSKQKITEAYLVPKIAPIISTLQPSDLQNFPKVYLAIS